MARAPIPMADSSNAIQPADVRPTILPDSFLESPAACAAAHFRMPRFRELPRMALYRDQVITYIEQVFEPLGSGKGEAWITPAMVNNYVKCGLVPAPQKKLYSRPHIARLLLVCMFKQLLPISAIQRLFTIQKMTYPDDVAYDYVATELEHALASALSTGEPSEDSASVITRESLLVRSAVGAFASKTFLMSYLEYSGIEG